MKKLEKTIYLITDVLSGIAGIMMAVLTGFVFMEVLCRYVFKRPIVITSEMTNLLFPWIVALSAIAIAKSNGNTALVFIKERFKGTTRHVIEILVHMVMLYFSVSMIIASFSLSLSLRNEILVLTGISKMFTYGSMVVGFSGVALVVSYNLIKYILFDILKTGGEEKC
ncbi:MAG: TRAP transporter small permease subunit [Fusobacteriaceae bacterium]|nr:TRAP transporter small permease subunit [Fusobacteriaceae bacterium]